MLDTRKRRSAMPGTGETMRVDADIRNWAAVTVVALALLAGCSGEKRPAAAPPPPKAAAPVAAAAPAVRPEGADAVDAALTEAQLFNATATESLVDIATKEVAIRDLAAKAVDLAKKAENAGVPQRPGLAKAFAGVIADREAAHEALGQSLEAFRTTSAETSSAVDAAAALCGPVAAPPAPGTLGAYPGCATLAAEQASLAQSVAGLSKVFEAAEAAYRQDRRRVDEAAATMALVR
jgi:hypothetical protein